MSLALRQWVWGTSCEAPHTMGNGAHIGPTDFWELKPSLLIYPSSIKKKTTCEHTCAEYNEFGYDMAYNEYMNYIHFISWTEN